MMKHHSNLLYEDISIQLQCLLVSGVADLVLISQVPPTKHQNVDPYLLKLWNNRWNDVY